MSRNIKKGNYGYINQQKRRYIIYIIVGLLSTISCFVISMFLEDNAKFYATFFAVFIILPTALWTVRYVLLKKYASINSCDYKVIKEYSTEPIKDKILFDLVITQEKSITNIPFCLVNNNMIIIYSMNDDKEALKKKQKELYNILKPKQYEAKIHVYSSIEKLQKYFKIESATEELDYELIRLLLVHSV